MGIDVEHNIVYVFVTLCCISIFAMIRDLWHADHYIPFNTYRTLFIRLVAMSRNWIIVYRLGISNSMAIVIMRIFYF
jgi:hypothetical protein